MEQCRHADKPNDKTNTYHRRPSGAPNHHRPTTILPLQPSAVLDKKKETDPMLERTARIPQETKEEKRVRKDAQRHCTSGCTVTKLRRQGLWIAAQKAPTMADMPECSIARAHRHF
mmetsp:Transcript_13055/g.20496  ORF Transcript_13055/g.20496 Transcript_13055/m.20496 type:complete len:116 (+) Transcript_13055:774-1121(+)